MKIVRAFQLEANNVEDAALRTDTNNLLAVGSTLFTHWNRQTLMRPLEFSIIGSKEVEVILAVLNDAERSSLSWQTGTDIRQRIDRVRTRYVEIQNLLTKEDTNGRG